MVQASRMNCKINGTYTCRICSKDLASSYALKKHIFKVHSDIDVTANYWMSLENFVGAAAMAIFRKGLYVLLDKDKINEMIE
jgi:hypothetical protein